MNAALKHCPTPYGRYPQVRVFLNASPLRLHFSPSRYVDLMRVVDGLSPPRSAAPPAAAAGAPQQSQEPLWRADAEYVTKVGTRVSGC